MADHPTQNLKKKYETGGFLLYLNDNESQLFKIIGIRKKGFNRFYSFSNENAPRCVSLSEDEPHGPPKKISNFLLSTPPY